MFEFMSDCTRAPLSPKFVLSDKGFGLQTCRQSSLKFRYLMFLCVVTLETCLLKFSKKSIKKKHGKSLLNNFFMLHKARQTFSFKVNSTLFVASEGGVAKYA